MYFKQNVAEAKKLLAAAGFNEWLRVPRYLHQHAAVRHDLPEPVPGAVELHERNRGQDQDHNPDYQTVWLNNYYNGKGNFEGVAIGADSTEADVGCLHVRADTSQGRALQGASIPSGSNPSAGDPESDEAIDDIRQGV